MDRLDTDINYRVTTDTAAVRLDCHTSDTAAVSVACYTLAAAELSQFVLNNAQQTPGWHSGLVYVLGLLDPRIDSRCRLYFFTFLQHIY